MITPNEITQAIDWIEKHSIIGAVLIGSVGYTIKGIVHGIFSSRSVRASIAWLPAEKAPAFCLS